MFKIDLEKYYLIHTSEKRMKTSKKIISHTEYGFFLVLIPNLPFKRIELILSS